MNTRTPLHKPRAKGIAQFFSWGATTLHKFILIEISECVYIEILSNQPNLIVLKRTLKDRMEDVIGMGGPEFSGYLQSLGATLTVVVLTVGFIFTALTLILLEMPDVANVLTQATLLILIVAFGLGWFSTVVLMMRIQLLSQSASTARLPSTPGWRFYNLLILSTVFLMSISINLMVFSRGLTYLGLVSVAILSLWFAVFFICIYPSGLKGAKTSKLSND